MVDLAVNSSLNVFIAPDGDIGFVEGREAFEQRVALQLTDRYYDIIGDLDPAEVVARLRMEAQRVADSDPNIDTMPTFDVEFSSEEHKTMEVTIVYDTGDTTEFTI